MKVKTLMLKNFGKVSEVSVNFDDSITYLIGGNGAGKTTVGLNGPWFILQGLAAKATAGSEVFLADRYRFIGPHGKSASGTIEIHDEKNGVIHTVTRKLLKNKTELEIKSSDGVQRGQEFLDSLFSSILIDPRRFFKMSSKDQALAFGVDTSVFDEQRKVLEADRLKLYQEKSRLKQVVKSAGEVEKAEEVSISGLLKTRTEMVGFNLGVNEQEHQFKEFQNECKAIEGRIHRLRNQLQEEENALDKNQKNIQAVSKIPHKKDLSEIDAQIEAAETTNVKAREYQKAIENQKAYDEAKDRHQAKDDEIAVLDGKRAKYIKDQKLPYSNMTINETGELLIDGKPFCEPYWSTGEALKFGALLGAKIAQRQDAKLDYVWISGCQDLDEQNRENLFAALENAGLQVVAEFVDTKKQKKGTSILLKEMQVVESYEDKKAGKELA